MNSYLLHLLSDLTQGKNPKIYTYDQIDEVLFLLGTVDIIRKKSKIEYYNIACSFDIETSSFYTTNQLDKQKVAIMYEWSLCLGGYLIIGRTWEQFNYIYDKLYTYFELGEYRRLIIYVHNLSFEFQFIRKRLSWLKVFSLEQRKPIQAITYDGIEFRCSYLLSGYSLNNLGNQLHTYKVKKLVGDLNYDLIRHSKTPLTDREIGYCVVDVLVVVAYIQELIEQYGNITKLPLTKTGFVRNYCRENCLYNKENKKDTTKYHKFRKIIKSLVLDSDTYKQLKRAFAGGFTHANVEYSGDVVNDVYSNDFTSSYPYVMISEKFPMSIPHLVKDLTNEKFVEYTNKYCCLFDAEFFDIDTYDYYENYISSSHCKQLQGGKINNGRVVSAKHLIITLTEQDYFIIRTTYKWENMRIYNFKYFFKDYLPTDLIKSILQLYYDKTTLKGIPEKEVEYLQSKERINAVYGMCVTDIVRDEISYVDEWLNIESDIDEELNKYNKSIKRFLYYPWGVWVTAYARMNLWTAILELKHDYIYSDTDSVKYINRSNHIDYFNAYDKLVMQKLKKAMDYHKIDIELTRPKNIKGEEKQIGIWDYEGKYKRFKTLGAKRYLIEKEDNKHIITVSGVSKQKAIEYMEKQNKDIFEQFDNELVIPANSTGKLTHTYIDEERCGYVKDYLGNKCYYNELSSIHLEKAEYSLSISQEYANFILDIKTIEK